MDTLLRVSPLFHMVNEPKLIFLILKDFNPILRVERPKLYEILAFLSAVGSNACIFKVENYLNLYVLTSCFILERLVLVNWSITFYVKSTIAI